MGVIDLYKIIGNSKKLPKKNVVNSILEGGGGSKGWTLVGSALEGDENPIPLPSDFVELLVVVESTASDAILIPKLYLTEDYRRFNTYSTNSVSCDVSLTNFKSNKVTVNWYVYAR